MGKTTAVGTKVLPKPPGSSKCCVKIEKYTYRILIFGVKMTYYPSNIKIPWGKGGERWNARQDYGFVSEDEPLIPAEGGTNVGGRIPALLYSAHALRVTSDLNSNSSRRSLTYPFARTRL